MLNNRQTTIILIIFGGVVVLIFVLYQFLNQEMRVTQTQMSGDQSIDSTTIEAEGGKGVEEESETLEINNQTLALACEDCNSDVYPLPDNSLEAASIQKYDELDLPLSEIAGLEVRDRAITILENNFQISRDTYQALALPDTLREEDGEWGFQIIVGPTNTGLKSVEGGGDYYWVIFDADERSAYNVELIKVL